MSGINIVGPGGIIEGTTNDVNVNVNLDSSLSFDGVDDKIEVSATPRALVGNSNDFTVSAWIYPTAVSGYIFGAMENSGERFYLRLDNQEIKHAYGSTVTSTSVDVPLNAWTHIAVQYDVSATEAKTFVNGVLKHTASSVSGADITNTDNLNIGALNNNGSIINYFTGEIADLKIYNAEVSDADIAILASKINQDPSVTSAVSLEP